MRTITATFEVVTPMFLGGADQSPSGIRPSSVKGALRFWWRAWAWSASRARHAEDNSALQELHAQEARLFGLAAKKSSNGEEDIGGQGVFVMHVRDQTVAPSEEPFGRNFDNGILYLLGQGLGKLDKERGTYCTRSAIPEQKGNRKSGFEVKLIFKPRTAESDVTAIRTALQLFGLLGALGSRSRHGLGSVSLTAMQGEGLAWQAPQSVPEYKQALRQLLSPATGTEIPPLSAFSRHTRIDASLDDADVLRLLARLGREQQEYRSYGRDRKDGKGHMVNGKPAKQRFKGDHDLMFKAAGGEVIKQVPERVVFGLPHNYRFSSGANVGVNFKSESGEGRRASPLLLHIHRIGEKCLAVHTLLQARFLPERAGIEIKSRQNQRIYVQEADFQWQALHKYLDQYQAKSDIWERIHG